MSAIPISKASRNLSHWINKANYGNECVVLTSHGKPKAVLLGVDAFETLLGIDADAQLLPAEELQQLLSESLNNAGYSSREQIIELVQDVKRDLADTA